MKLHENQLNLVRHLARFQRLDYTSCLHVLDTAQSGDFVALSYVFRPLTKNKYLAKRKDSNVTILAKGRKLFPDEKPLISVGGGAKENKRVLEVSRMAAYMEENGIPCVGEIINRTAPYFIPSACWRKIAPGILSTTRFTGILLLEDRRLAVYDIGDGKMEWQLRAESSLFYTRYGSCETKATGMILVCREGERDKIAEQIIRQTMWNRRRLVQSSSYAERDRPVRWSNAPIRLRSQYEKVYLTTPGNLSKSIDLILREENLIESMAGQGDLLTDPAQGDCENWPYRYFVNPATDLLKYVYFFSTAMSLLALRENIIVSQSGLNYAIVLPQRDFPILRLYPDVLDMKGLKIYEYRPEKDTE